MRSPEYRDFAAMLARLDARIVARPIVNPPDDYGTGFDARIPIRSVSHPPFIPLPVKQ